MEPQETVLFLDFAQRVRELTDDYELASPFDLIEGIVAQLDPPERIGAEDARDIINHLKLAYTDPALVGLEYPFDEDGTAPSEEAIDACFRVYSDFDERFGALHARGEAPTEQLKAEVHPLLKRCWEWECEDLVKQAGRVLNILFGRG